MLIVTESCLLNGYSRFHYRPCILLMLFIMHCRSSRLLNISLHRHATDGRSHPRLHSLHALRARNRDANEYAKSWYVSSPLRSTPSCACHRCSVLRVLRVFMQFLSLLHFYWSKWKCLFCLLISVFFSALCLMLIVSSSSRDQPQTRSTTTFSPSPFAFSPLNGWLIHTRKPPCTTGLSSTSSTKGTSCRSSGCWTSCPSCRSCPIYLGQMSRQPTTVAPMAITAIASQR